MNWIRITDQIPPMAGQVLAWSPIHDSFATGQFEIITMDDTGKDELTFTLTRAAGAWYEGTVSHWCAVVPPVSEKES